MGSVQLGQEMPGKEKQSNHAIKNVSLCDMVSKLLKEICLFQCTLKNKYCYHLVSLFISNDVESLHRSSCQIKDEEKGYI